jgi:hypothetical protein
MAIACSYSTRTVGFTRTLSALHSGNAGSVAPANETPAFSAGSRSAPGSGGKLRAECDPARHSDLFELRRRGGGVFLPGMGSGDVGGQRWNAGRGPVGRVPRCKARLRWSPELECRSGDDSATVAGPGHRTLGQSEQRGLRRSLTSPTAWRVTWAKGELGSQGGTPSADSPQRMSPWADAWRAEVSGRDAEGLGHGVPPCSRALLHFASVLRDHDGRRVAVRHPATVRRCCAWQRSDR